MLLYNRQHNLQNVQDTHLGVSGNSTDSERSETSNRTNNSVIIVQNCNDHEKFYKHVKRYTDLVIHMNNLVIPILFVFDSFYSRMRELHLQRLLCIKQIVFHIRKKLLFTVAKIHDIHIRYFNFIFINFDILSNILRFIAYIINGLTYEFIFT